MRRRRFGRLARGTRRFNAKRLTQRQKNWIERRRRRFFQEDLEFDDVRRSNRKRALFSVTRRRGHTYESKILERHPKGRTIIDVMKIIKANSND
tara:strand:- start:459 stop:740 length:282 start_codon:yes stop_codon:yes gene_type:complete